LYALAGERNAITHGGAEQAAKELGTAGALARREGRMKLAEALWRVSLRWDYTNIRSRSSLGQLLHHQGRYEEAVESLEPVAEIDNYAQLFLGWSQLQLGLSAGDAAAADEGLGNVVAGLRRWCAHSDRSSRGAWLRQIRRLWQFGPKFRLEVEQLVSFAKANSIWPPVTMAQVEAARSGNEGDDELSDLPWPISEAAEA
jgi:tetratricopeptide (TPR) repeat protein